MTNRSERKLGAKSIRHKSTKHGLQRPVCLCWSASWSCPLMPLSPQQHLKDELMCMTYFALPQILSWMCFQQTAERNSKLQGKLLCMSLIVAIWWVMAKLLLAQWQIICLCSSKTIFHHASSTKHALAETFLKEIRVRETEWWSPESCPTARLPFLSPQSP